MQLSHNVYEVIRKTIEQVRTLEHEMHQMNNAYRHFLAFLFFLFFHQHETVNEKKLSR